ncbi:MAG: hypothetical protein QQN63_04840 [Nitrosopumilus sp.]
MTTTTEVEAKAIELLEKSQNDPVGWTYAILGRTLTWYQARIMEDVRDYTRVAVRSCNSIGKDFAAGCIALWWVHQWPDAQVVTTAPTWHQVEQIQWRREIHKLYEQAVYPLGGKMQTTSYRLGPERVAFGISVNNKEAMQGIHSDHILIIVTEASAPQFDDELMEGIDALMAGGDAKILMLSNPTRQEGSLFRAFNSQRAQWRVRRVSAFDTPNVQACMKLGPHRIPDECANLVKGLISHQWITDMAEKYGENSDFYRVHILGEFPLSGSDSLIPLSWVEAARERGAREHGLSPG